MTRSVALLIVVALWVTPALRAEAEGEAVPCLEGFDPVARLVLSLGACAWTNGSEPIIFGSSIPFLPPPSAVDDVLDTLRVHTDGRTHTQNSSLDEKTTLNAIALARQSETPFSLEDVADRAASATWDMTWLNVLLPHRSVILNILTLGVKPVEATAFDVSYGGTFDATAAEQMTRRLSDANTLSGLALLGGGVPLDPRVLIDLSDEVRDHSRVGTFPAPSRPPDAPDIVAQAAIAPIGGQRAPGVFAFSNRSVEHNDSFGRTRSVDLPDDVVFAGLALHRNGIPFDAVDALSFSADERLAVDDSYDYNRERAVLLYWLTLGLGFDPRE